MVVKGNLRGVFTWGDYNYGYKTLKRKNIHYNVYYKSKNARFDDTCGGTEECSEEEYHQAASKRASILYKD